MFYVLMQMKQTRVKTSRTLDSGPLKQRSPNSNNGVSSGNFPLCECTLLQDCVEKL
jgi:hypothetical protein